MHHADFNSQDEQPLPHPVDEHVGAQYCPRAVNGEDFSYTPRSSSRSARLPQAIVWVLNMQALNIVFNLKMLRISGMILGIMTKVWNVQLIQLILILMPTLTPAIVTNPPMDPEKIMEGHILWTLHLIPGKFPAVIHRRGNPLMNPEKIMRGHILQTLFSQGISELKVFANLHNGATHLRNRGTMNKQTMKAAAADTRYIYPNP
ncbi:hypothetical protein DXG01_012810 [Tephrocybe rancida]|nr:hypothetical protein DXG01_012810 [Tephrocybe rancida]